MWTVTPLPLLCYFGVMEKITFGGNKKWGDWMAGINDWYIDIFHFVCNVCSAISILPIRNTLINKCFLGSLTPPVYKSSLPLFYFLLFRNVLSPFPKKKDIEHFWNYLCVIIIYNKGRVNRHTFFKLIVSMTNFYCLYVYETWCEMHNHIITYLFPF